MAALPEGLDRADRSEVRMAAPKGRGPKGEHVGGRATVAKLLRLMTCVVRWRELSASFLVAFPGAWLAWLSLSVDGGGKAELSEGTRCCSQDPRWSQELSILPGRLTRGPCASVRGRGVHQRAGV